MPYFPVGSVINHVSHNIDHELPLYVFTTRLESYIVIDDVHMSYREGNSSLMVA